ncbi:MAG: sigma-70 family RNA polymerase sigma factor [Acutalibacteraceae bacterium]|nr:sigma-70 family RNA polymerase sigma factor [Acutalibacteraceae bacterium]
MDNRDSFINNNMGLVHSCCKKFKGRGIEYDDLFQAGCIGLIKAADGFDEERGLCFSTYAVPVILGEIKRMFRDGGSVKVSRTLRELAIKIKYEQEKALKEHGKELTCGELAAILSVTPEEVAESLNATQPTVSLTYESDDGTYEVDLAVSNNGDMLTDKLMLGEVIKRLPQKEQSLLKMRYFESKTQNETAKALSMTQVQVSRAEKKILKSLRYMLNE